MIPKPIHYTTHGHQARRDRNVTRADVRRMIATGERRLIPSTGPTQYWEVFEKIGGRTIGVVFIENGSRYLIVTVEDFSEEKK